MLVCVRDRKWVSVHVCARACACVCARVKNATHVQPSRFLSSVLLPRPDPGPEVRGKTPMGTLDTPNRRLNSAVVRSHLASSSCPPSADNRAARSTAHMQGA